MQPATVGRNHQKSFQSMQPNSMNIVSRMQELQKIEEENHKIAKHLYYNKGYIDHREFEEFFQEQKEHLDRIVRVKPKITPKYQGKPGRMSPLNIGGRKSPKKGALISKDVIPSIKNVSKRKLSKQHL